VRRSDVERVAVGDGVAQRPGGPEQILAAGADRALVPPVPVRLDVRIDES
jgi:hypothetical protein